MLTAKRSGLDSLVHALPQVVRSAPGRPLRSPRPLPSLRPLRTLAAGPTRRRRPARPPAQRPEFGPFDLFAEWAHALYVEGRADEALVACAAGLLVVEPAGDRETARFLRYVACLVLAQQGRWSSLVHATQDHLDNLRARRRPVLARASSSRCTRWRWSTSTGRPRRSTCSRRRTASSTRPAPRTTGRRPS